jgi:hypothetical protein
MADAGASPTPAVATNAHSPALAACAPVLPPGYESQPASIFSDGSGQGSYEFHRVYAPAKSLPGRASIVAGKLDEARSYWGVTWTVHGAGGATHPAASWVSFADARKKQSSLTFKQFSSATHMRQDLAALRR